MTRFMDLSDYYLLALRLWALFLTFASLYAVARAWRIGAGALQRAAVCLVLGTSYLLTQLLINSYGERTLIEGALVWPLGALMLAVTGVLAWQEGALTHRERTRIGPMSIKKAADALPTGLCFYGEDGQVRLLNAVMLDMATRLLGRYPRNGEAFWRDLLAAASAEGERPVVRLPDARVFQLSRRPVTVEGRRLWEITAADVTALDRANAQLRERNLRLEAVNARMRRYGQALTDMIRDQELLAARVAMHDEVGQVLLATRYCLEHPDRMDANGVLAMWEHLSGILLRNAEADEDVASDLFLNLIDVARSIGVRVEVDGELPASEPAYTLLAKGLHTCITNVRKHAEGDWLGLRVREADGLVTAVYTNNGRPPRGRVRETGGLRSLRELVEGAGGTMEVESVGAFRLTLRVPQDEATAVPYGAAAP